MRNGLPNYHLHITNQSWMSFFNCEQTGKNLPNQIVRMRGRLYFYFYFFNSPIREIKHSKIRN